MLDHHERGFGNIDTNLHDGRTNKHIELTGPKLFHDTVFSLVAQAAVDQADAKGSERALAQLFKGCLGGFQVECLGCGHERTDDVSLAALAQAVAKVSIKPGAAPWSNPARAHRLAPGRHLPDGGNVEVAEYCQGNGARNRCGRHDQVVRIDAQAAHAGALVDAKLMLFVDHDEAETGELHILLDECLRADDKVDFPGLNCLESFLPLPGASSGRRRPCACLD